MNHPGYSRTGRIKTENRTGYRRIFGGRGCNIEN
jgi:hypothetical protein